MLPVAAARSEALQWSLAALGARFQISHGVFPVGLKKTHYRDHTESHTERKQPMNDNILRFPGFILLEDRNTVLKDGKRYKSMKALIDEDQAYLSVADKAAT